MTTIRQFRCDFCRVVCEADDIYGLRWNGGPDLVEREPDQANQHLCPHCMSAIKRVGINQEARPLFLDADGDEVEMGRLYWLKLGRGLTPAAWFQVKCLGLGQATVTTERGPSWTHLYPTSDRLHRNLPPGTTGCFYGTKEPDKPPETPAEDPPSESEGPDIPLGPEVSANEAADYLGNLGYTRDGSTFDWLTAILLVRPLLAKLAEAKPKLAPQATAPRGVLNWRRGGPGKWLATSQHTEDYLLVLSGTKRWTAYYGGVAISTGPRDDCEAACEALERDPDAIPVFSKRGDKT